MFKIIFLFQKIVHNPLFIVDGISRFDFGQGIVGEKNIFQTFDILNYKRRQRWTGSSMLEIYLIVFLCPLAA